MSEPLISVVVLNWNGLDYLDRCLESLERQNFRDFEVVLVDNGSTDGSVERVRERCGEIFRLVLLPENRGFCGGNNVGIRASRGRLIALLNNDTEVDPDWLATLAAAAERSGPRVGMWASRVMIDSRRTHFDSTGLLVYPDGICRSRGWLEKDVGQYDAEEEILAPNGCAALYRRDLLDEVGLFDERYFAYMEDLDLGLRGQLAGWRCLYEPGAVVYHKKSSTTGKHSKFKAFYVERNRIWNLAKLMPPGSAALSGLRTLERYILQAYAAAAYRGVSGNFARDYSKRELFVVLVRAYLSAAKGLPETLLNERRLIQSFRKIGSSEFRRIMKRFELTSLEIALKD